MRSTWSLLEPAEATGWSTASKTASLTHLGPPQDGAKPGPTWSLPVHGASGPLPEDQLAFSHGSSRLQGQVFWRLQRKVKVKVCCGLASDSQILTSALFYWESSELRPGHIRGWHPHRKNVRDCTALLNPSPYGLPSQREWDTCSCGEMHRADF